MAKLNRQRLELKTKTTLKTTIKYRMVFSGSALAVAVLFGIGLFMYGNIGNNTETKAANSKQQNLRKALRIVENPKGPTAVNAICTGTQVALNWTNSFDSKNASATNGILILRKQGVAPEDQSVEKMEMDTTGHLTSFNGWEIVYNSNLVSSFTDNTNVKGSFTYLVYEKNDGIKYTEAKNAARIFVLNGENLSETISADTKIDGLYLSATNTLTVDEKSTLVIRSGALMNIGGTFALNGEIDNNASSWDFAAGSQFIYNRNGNNRNAIPNAKWENGSACLIQGINGKEPAGLNQSFENFTWDCANQTSDITLPEAFTVNGSFSVKSTGKKVKTLWLAGANSFHGDLLVNDGSAKVDMKKKTEVVLNGTTPQLIQGTWNFQTLTINNATEFTVAGNITVTKVVNLTNGTLKLANGGLAHSTLKIGDGVVINRANGSLAGTPSFTGTYDLNYLAAVTTGDELASTNALRNLTINCSGDVKLNKTANINGTLEFVNGKIITGVNEVNVKSASSNSIKGYSATAYVAGNLRRSIDGKGIYDFPVGTATNCEVISVNLANTAGANNILAQFVSAKPSTMPLSANLMLNGTPVANMLDYGYWSLTANSPITAGSYSVTVNEKGQLNKAPSVGCLCVLQKPEGASAWGFAGNHLANTQFVNNGTVTAGRSGLTGMGDFAIAYSGASILMSRSSLTASVINNQTEVVWRTNTELNNPAIVLERSNDAYNFDAVGEMKDNGKTGDLFEFTFKDANPLPGTSYYRVKQTDMDGTISYSDIRFISNQVKNTASVNEQK